MSDVTKMLQVRDVPDEIHAELRRRAASAGMNLSQYALQELTRLARRPTVSELLDRAAARASDRLSFREAREAVVQERPEA